MGAEAGNTGGKHDEHVAKRQGTAANPETGMLE
jgi:hypothetical protein